MSIRKKRAKKDEPATPVETGIPETDKSEDELLHPEQYSVDQSETKQKKPMKRRTKVILIIIAIVVVCCIISAITGGSDTTQTATDETTATETTEATDETTEETKPPRKAEMPDVEGMKADKAVATLQDAGFQDITIEATNGLDIDVEDPAVSAYVVTRQDHEADKKTKTEEAIVLTCKTEAQDKEDKAQAKLSKTIVASSAWRAVTEYGEDQYPFGFKVNKTGRTKKAYDKETWFLKGKCTVTNEYGAKATMTVEAYVTGTDANPILESIDIY